MKGISIGMLFLVCLVVGFLLISNSTNMDSERYKKIFCENIGVSYDPGDWEIVNDNENISNSEQGLKKELFGRNEDVRLDVEVDSRHGNVERVVVSIRDWLSSRKTYDAATDTWSYPENTTSVEKQLDYYATAALSAWYNGSDEQAVKVLQESKEPGYGNVRTEADKVSVWTEEEDGTLYFYIDGSSGDDDV